MVFRISKYYQILFIFLLCWMASGDNSASSDLAERTNAFFTDMKESFDTISKSATLRSVKLRPTDRYFVKVLKRYQPIYILMRTNSKGVVVNEVIRGQKPERHYRNISRQRWFSRVQKNLTDHYGYIKEDNGRYYLFWSSPIMITTRSGNKRFGGAVVAKIDLWDCIHEFSRTVEEPFKVRLSKRTIYAHKANMLGDKVAAKELTVPGADLTILYEEQPIPSEPPPDSVIKTEEIPQTVVPTPEENGTGKAQSGVSQLLPDNPKQRRKIYLIGIISGAILFCIFLFWAITKIQQKLLIRRIEREELL